MKRNFFFIALALCAGMLAPTGLSAQKRVIKVQGHPHELLTQLHGDKEDARILPQLTGTPTDTIKFSDIKCWAGVVDNTQEIDSAVLLVKFTSLPQFEYSQDSILAFGYRWNPLNQYGDSIHKYTIDMFRAIANADCRFLVMIQYTGPLGFTIGGIGYTYGSSAYRPWVQFKDSAAAADTDQVQVIINQWTPASILTI